MQKNFVAEPQAVEEKLQPLTDFESGILADFAAGLDTLDIARKWRVKEAFIYSALIRARGKVRKGIE